MVIALKIDEMTLTPFIQRLLIDWYQQNQRDLPWRGSLPNPYHVLISEVMLQQTTVATVKGYFAKFLHRWPTIQDLADASHDDLMQCWQGLGYYSRARNLHKTAKIITEQLSGKIPSTYGQLIMLPGLGHYTAAAVASIAFGQAIIAIDTNVNRVLCRLFGVVSAGKQQKADVQAIADQLAHPNHSGEISQALMDVGSNLCRAKNPRCDGCFLKNHCTAYLTNTQDTLPIRPLKPARPKRFGHTFVMRHDTKICIEKRPEKGLLAGLYHFPSNDFLSYDAEPTYPHPADWQHIGSVRHVFTHFELELKIWHTFVENPSPGLWVEMQNLKNFGLPTLYRKALTYVQNKFCNHSPKSIGIKNEKKFHFLLDRVFV